MKIKNLNFKTWCKNHNNKHDAKWCRELYPWAVFNEIDYDEQYIGINQEISLNGLVYNAKIIDTEFQENGRLKSTFELFTNQNSGRKKWEERSWNNAFQIVYSQDGEFITVFTKKEDPSKGFVSKFMKGNFTKIVENKSIPISELLFKSLISYIVEENYKTAEYLQKFELLPQGIRVLQEHKQFINKKMKFYPLFSVGRELWITYSFNEEKAHRIAFYMANQCNHFIVVYCNPTYTKHHRCTYLNTEIISLYELINRLSPLTRTKFEKQVRFLQNHLNIPTAYSRGSLLEEIKNPFFSEYEIIKSDIMEALGILKIDVTNAYDAFYYLAAMNLMNAWLNRKKKIKNGILMEKEEKLFKNMYFFKTYVQKVITNLIINNIPEVEIFIDKDLVIVEIFKIQFSFHNIPSNQIISEFIRSNKYRPIEWSGKRLQPIAPLILNYARMTRNEYYEKA
ncbi:hypothetical protein UF75_3363 [Desulfosporosinus sp. I2]|uniref:hypothetical protein n=1 Tax=Desulfosporosinus sp. I2 TaxID=1617025 RepID=UPI0005EE2E47|nr:hypothetical protein [Desulfosporosinus sp. I2]KJR46277.1 hypothetical protein UF75_3363 [Desulfosporosinus sp. I2]